MLRNVEKVLFFNQKSDFLKNPQKSEKVKKKVEWNFKIPLDLNTIHHPESNLWTKVYDGENFFLASLLITLKTLKISKISKQKILNWILLGSCNFKQRVEFIAV